MRIAVTGDDSPGIIYRANDPLQAMLRRGHSIVWPNNEQNHLDLEQVATCDVLHVYRFRNDKIREIIQTMARDHGVACTWDTDDDYSAYSPEFPSHVMHGPEMMAEVFRESVETAKLAQVATFTSEPLAEVYRAQGVEHVEVIENAARAGFMPPRPHKGIVIGWIAGGEHVVELRRFELAETLRRIQEAHPQVHVEAYGVDLGLSERYSFTPFVPLDELPRRMAGFDIGLAPLADLRFNHSRSNIKIKEYAAASVAWLASPQPPYLGHGEEQGGRLVPDDGWFEAIDQLVRDPQQRRRLSARGQAWGRSQRIESVADRWEAVFERAVATLKSTARG